MSLRTKIAMVGAAAVAACLFLLIIQGLRLRTDAGRTGGGGRPPVARDAARLQAAFDAEFHTRPDGYKGMCAHYGFSFPRPPKQMDPGLMYRAVADGAVDIIDGFATDGRIPAYDLLVLEDDRHFFPPYYAAPLVRKATLDAHPEIAAVLGELAGRIPDAVMQQLNYQVDEQGMKASDVAREFLVEQRLIPAEGTAPETASAASVTIGGKQFTEQEVLGELMATLLEHKTGLEVVRRLNLGGTMICFNALRSGDLDIYAEYTGTGLVNILKRDVISEPETAYRVVKDEFAAEYDLVWLGPFGFNNTYTLTMRRAQAEDLGLETISDLARFFGAGTESN